MMKSFIILLAATVLLNSSSSLELSNEKAKYENYRLCRVHLVTEEHVQIFQELEEQSDSCTFMGHALYPNQNLTIMVAAHKVPDFNSLVERFGITNQVLLSNIQELINAEEITIKSKETPPSEFDWENYFHLETIYRWMEDLSEKHSFLTVFTIGESFEGRPIKGIKLSKQTGNTGIIIEAGIHAREWISPATATFILNQLITSEEESIQEISQKFDWYFIPVVNTDGYVFSFEYDRLWRKTRKPYGLCVGVDLNRNFDSNWSGNGSSSNPCGYDFSGSKYNSEPEADNLSKWVESISVVGKIKTYISLHSFSQLLMFPFGYTPDHVKNYEDLKNIGEIAAKALSQRYGTVFQTGSAYETIYPASGRSVDTAVEKNNIPIAFSFELRGPPNSTDLFILPADQITPVGLETLDAFVAILTEAGNMGYYSSGFRLKDLKLLILFLVFILIN